MRQRLLTIAAGAFAAAFLALAGCQPEDKGTKDSGTKPKGEETKVAAKTKHEHWWCKEHGMPEDECLVCLIERGKVKEDDLKKKGDWCDQHDRPKSQCFKCDPKLKEKYAAMYRAKYGKEPPPTEDDEDEKDAKKDKPADKKDGK
jgi:hypothetical protein